MLNRVIVVAAILVGLYGCQAPKSTLGYETFPKDARHDTETARKHNAAAVKLIDEEKFDQAEKELKAALTADIFFGPAHNNLGTVYYQAKKYYAAAWEFQYAAKLMIDSPQPRTNLGLVFEAVGRLDEAAEWYNEALALAPDSIEATGNLARVMVRTKPHDDRTKELLGDVLMKDNRPEWLAWARKRLALLGTPVLPAEGEPEKQLDPK